MKLVHAGLVYVNVAACGLSAKARIAAPTMNPHQRATCVEAQRVLPVIANLSLPTRCRMCSPPLSLRASARPSSMDRLPNLFAHIVAWLSTQRPCRLPQHDSFYDDSIAHEQVRTETTAGFEYPSTLKTSDKTMIFRQRQSRTRALSSKRSPYADGMIGLSNTGSTPGPSSIASAASSRPAAGRWSQAAGRDPRRGELPSAPVSCAEPRVAAAIEVQYGE